MIRKNILITLFIALAYPVLSCQCMPQPIEKDHTRYDYIFAGKIIDLDLDEDVYSFILIKSWKGNFQSDTLRMVFSAPDGCHRFRPRSVNEYYLLFVDSKGVYNCSPSGFYDDSSVIEKIDELFQSSIWVNQKYEAELSRLEHNRKYVLETANGEINVQHKRIILTSKKDVQELKQPTGFYEHTNQLWILATKSELTQYPQAPDYIIEYNSDASSERKKQKLIKRTMRKLKRNHL